MTRSRRFCGNRRGFTLVELMIVIAVLGIIAALTAPSFQRMIASERVRGVHNQLLTDLNFTRSETVSRGITLNIKFESNSAQTCYIIYARSFRGLTSECSCLSTPRCPSLTTTGLQEIRTVVLPRSDGISIQVPSGGLSQFALDPRTGSIAIPLEDYVGGLPQGLVVNTVGPSSLTLRATMALSGHVASCVPSGSAITGGTAC